MELERFDNPSVLYKNVSNVIKVTERGTDKQFVLKCTPLSQDSEREATVHQRLSFKNLKVVNQRKFYSEGECLYSLMDYAPGGSLRDYVNSLEAPLSNEEYLKLIYRLLVAVEGLHTSGWAHGNIKPENFVRDENGTWMLIDFGLTRRIKKVETPQPDISKQMTKYSSRPERHFCEDVWWLGLTCYWVATRDTLMDKPPMGQNWLLNQYVSSNMNVSYPGSLGTIWIVQQMMNLNDSERGTLEYLRGILDGMLPQENIEKPAQRSFVCQKCNEELPDEEFCVMHTCLRTICLNCYTQNMEEVAGAVQDLSDFRCVLCGDPVSEDVIVHYANALGPIAKEKVYSLMLLRLNTMCPRENCPGKVQRYKNKSEERSQITPYIATCGTCSQKFCSLCKKLDGHLKNGYSEMCPKFDKNQLRNLL